MKKKRLLISVIIITILIFAVPIIVWNNLPSDYLRIVKLNWNLSFPNETKLTELYAKTSGASFHGDGIRYHVYSYSHEHAEYLKESFDWETSESPTIYHENFTVAIAEWLNDIDVPKEKRPLSSECCRLYLSKHDNSEIIICLNNTENKLYIIESFL